MHKKKNNFRAARLNANISQSDVAKKLGHTSQTICHWEHGYSEADYDSLMDLAKLYSVSIDFLIGNIDKHEENKRKRIKKNYDVNIDDINRIVVMNRKKIIRAIHNVARLYKAEIKRIIKKNDNSSKK